MYFCSSLSNLLHFISQNISISHIYLNKNFHSLTQPPSLSSVSISLSLSLSVPFFLSLFLSLSINLIVAFGEKWVNPGSYIQLAGLLVSPRSLSSTMLIFLRALLPSFLFVSLSLSLSLFVTDQIYQSKVSCHKFFKSKQYVTY